MANAPLLLIISALPALILSAHVDVGIINGTKAKPHSRPYMVSVQKHLDHICGGFLVGDSFVMTAAHCWDMDGELTVVVGYQDLSSRESCTGRMTVKRYHVHPGYDSSTLENDIMILQLHDNVQSTTAQPIPLPNRREDVKDGSVCTASGWGAQTTDGPSVLSLLTANVTIFDRQNCQKLWGEDDQITSHMLCTYGGAGVCEGDSGGPLVCGGKAVGVVSFGEEDCDKPSLPNVYTKISSFLLWIKAIIGRKP